MELLIYLLILFVCEVPAVPMAQGLDYCGKMKNYNSVVRKKINIILFRSKYEENFRMLIVDKPISKGSFIFQWVNIAYVIIYIAIASIETFVYPNGIMRLVNVITAGIYGIINFFASIYLGSLSKRIL